MWDLNHEEDPDFLPRRTRRARRFLKYYLRALRVLRGKNRDFFWSLFNSQPLGRVLQLNIERVICWRAEVIVTQRAILYSACFQ